MSRRKQAETAPPVSAGDLDPMSKLAKKAGLPLCGAPLISEPLSCTRPAGHFEGFGRGIEHTHPSTLHVATCGDFIAQKVWHP